MSFEMRDCTSPVRVRVKNASDRRCRCRKTAARRSCITRWPTWFESSVWTTPSTPLDDRDRDHPAGEIATAASCPESGIAGSGSPCSRNAGMTPSAAEKTISARTAPSRPRTAEEPRDAAQVRPAHGRIVRALRAVRAPCSNDGRACSGQGTPCGTLNAVRVTVRLFAGLRERAGTARLEVDGVERVGDVWAKLGLGDEPAGLLYAVNREYVERDAALHDGDEVALIPPVSGGAFLHQRASRSTLAARRRGGGERRGRRGRDVRRHRAAPLARPRRAPSRVRGVRGDGRADARAARRRADGEARPQQGRDPPPHRARRDRRAERRDRRLRPASRRPRSTPAGRRSTRSRRRSRSGRKRSTWAARNG